MRTTVEIKPEHRAKLLELAARRGQKGFSSVLAEALDAYLEGIAEKGRLRRRAIRVLGTMPAAEAERLRRDAAAIREFWRQ